MLSTVAVALLSLQASSAYVASADLSAAEVRIQVLDPSLPQLPEAPAAPLVAPVGIRLAYPSLTDAYGCMPDSSLCRHLSAVMDAGQVVPGARVTPVGWEVPGTGRVLYSFVLDGDPGGWAGLWSTGVSGCQGAIEWDVCIVQARISSDFVQNSAGLRQGKELRRQQEAAGTAPRWTSGGEAPAPRSAPSTSSYSSSGTGGGGSPSSSAGRSVGKARF